MAAYRRVDDLRSPAGWLPIHRDQLRAQRSVSSMGKPLPFTFCLPLFVKPSQFSLSDVISKRTTFSQPFPPPSDPPANAPWFFVKHWLYINLLLACLLTYLSGVKCQWFAYDPADVTSVTTITSCFIKIQAARTPYNAKTVTKRECDAKVWT